MSEANKALINSHIRSAGAMPELFANILFPKRQKHIYARCRRIYFLRLEFGFISEILCGYIRNITKYNICLNFKKIHA